ncbi:MAG TPA: universal stress protein [Ktedonobacterales bacterium]|nr:universal stress protein [Ktedonobacterales bacterium]
MGLFERLGFPAGHATKIIDGQHPIASHAGGGAAPKPDMLPLPEGDGGKQAHCNRNILVAVSGKELDTELVTLACNLSKAKKGSVFVVFGIEVPRKLPIDAELPEETATASEALESAASVAQQVQVHVDPEIIQSRHFGQSLVEEAIAHECALLIVGLPYRIGLGGNFDLGETADYVLKNAPCKVWLVRGQRAELGEQREKSERSERPQSIGAAR